LGYILLDDPLLQTLRIAILRFVRTTLSNPRRASAMGRGFLYSMMHLGQELWGIGKSTALVAAPGWTKIMPARSPWPLFRLRDGDAHGMQPRLLPLRGGTQSGADQPAQTAAHRLLRAIAAASGAGYREIGKGSFRQKRYSC
jgi:hypothetical protein